MKGPINALRINLSNFFITKTKLTLLISLYQELLMSTPKIQLSKQEIDLINNTGWILTKHIIIKKIYAFFGLLLPVFQEMVKLNEYLFPENIRHQGGKISRGENYQLLPYVILDYPAFFWKENIFAIRTMFWWGNFFSITLQLSGSHKEKFTCGAHQLLPWLREKKFSICTGEGEWSHHFESDNYMDAVDIDAGKYAAILEKSFFKISKKIELTEYYNAEGFLTETFGELLQFLVINYRAGEKDLSPGFPKAGSGL